MEIKQASSFKKYFFSLFLCTNCILKPNYSYYYGIHK